MSISPASLDLSIANFRNQELTALMTLGSDTSSSFGDIFSQYQAGSDNSLSALDLNAAGSGSAGASSFAPDMLSNGSGSAYAMMTQINSLDVTYKAQYSELSQMESYLPKVQAAAQQLGNTANSDSNDSIKTRLQDFVQQYNAWVQRFNPDVQNGGLLANTQAAEIPLYELGQVIQNPFIGANDGLHGLADIGVAVDPNTGLMSVDASQLDQALAGNKPAVIAAIGDFSKNFAASASLFASGDNFIQHRLDNLNGAITYIDGNATAWQNEFGSGDPANPSGSVAQALAAYNNASSI